MKKGERNDKSGAICTYVGLTATVGYSHDLNSEYGGPVHPVPRGEAPGMQVQLLKSGTEREYASFWARGQSFFRIAGVCREIPDTERPFFTAITR